MTSDDRGILNRAKAGDHVLIRAEVVKVFPGHSALVELFSATDRYQAWVRPDHIVDVIPLGRDVPREPADGTWLTSKEDPGTGMPSVFRRDDVEGHNDPDRRYHRRWWDYGRSGWIDWPTVFGRGGDPTNRLIRPTLTGNPEPAGAAGAVTDQHDQ